MPTTKPRVAITMRPATHSVIAELAKLRGISRGRVISELLDEVAIPLGRTVALMQAARDAPEDVRRRLLAACLDAEAALNAAAGLGDTALRVIEEKARTGRPAGSSKGSNPRYVTRGSGPTRRGKR